MPYSRQYNTETLHFTLCFEYMNSFTGHYIRTGQ